MQAGWDESSEYVQFFVFVGQHKFLLRMPVSDVTSVRGREVLESWVTSIIFMNNGGFKLFEAEKLLDAIDLAFPRPQMSNRIKTRWW